MSYSAPYNKIGFVLDGVAQLQANVSFWACLWWDGLSCDLWKSGVLNMCVSWDIISLQQVYWDTNPS
jgi:hypothetical protein